MLEIVAVGRAVVELQDSLAHKVTILFSDKSTVVVYLKRKGGVEISSVNSGNYSYTSLL